MQQISRVYSTSQCSAAASPDSDGQAGCCYTEDAGKSGIFCNQALPCPVDLCYCRPLGTKAAVLTQTEKLENIATMSQKHKVECWMLNCHLLTARCNSRLGEFSEGEKTRADRKTFKWTKYFIDKANWGLMVEVYYVQILWNAHQCYSHSVIADKCHVGRD